MPGKKKSDIKTLFKRQIFLKKPYNYKISVNKKCGTCTTHMPPDLYL